MLSFIFSAIIIASMSNANPSVLQYENIFLAISPRKVLNPHCESDMWNPAQRFSTLIYVFDASFLIGV